MTVELKPVAWRYRDEKWGDHYWHYFTKEPRFKEPNEIWQPLFLQSGYQHRVAAAHYALFHDDPTDTAERLARYAEETNEVLQAFGMSREDMHRLVDYTWDRPAGEPAKEIGAALLTLTSLCVVAGYDVMACGEADLEKLQRPETIARIRAKRATRHGRGPLPGFDPAAAPNPQHEGK
jgi:hypothetical protein